MIVYLDTNIAIYAVENPPVWGPKAVARLAALRQAAPASCHLIFLDPPFDAPLFEPALAVCGKALASQGFVYLEAPAKWTDEQLREKTMWLATMIAKNRREAVMGVKALMLQDLGCNLEEQWTNERDYTTNVMRGARAEAAFPEFIARKGRPLTK